MSAEQTIRQPRAHNPFINPLVSETIEDPDRYFKTFSERILVGETLQIFDPTNAVLVGPQGSGKSMILNLMRYPILEKWMSATGSLPSPIQEVPPFLGVSLNLQRANFHVFGRRSIAKSMGLEPDPDLEAGCAADYLTHYLFREFCVALRQVRSDQGSLRSWLQIDQDQMDDQSIMERLNKRSVAFGYYSDCGGLDDMIRLAEQRTDTWIGFLNTNIDRVPEEILRTKSTPEHAVHAMGNLLNSFAVENSRPALFVIIDQYEQLPELNRTHGTLLQRIVNTLIKARDPVVFYKVGARTHDWGRETRVWGSEARIEVQRDYAIANLWDILSRGEDGLRKGAWLFPDFARDVALKRLQQKKYAIESVDDVERIFGKWSANEESSLYFRRDLADSPPRKKISGQLLKSKVVPDSLKKILASSWEKEHASPLELRLAEAWVEQQVKRSKPQREITSRLKDRPWDLKWWKKERIEIALLQIASLTNSKRRYYGWSTILRLSGGNITAFLMICGEIWDVATKMGVHPTEQGPLDTVIQNYGVMNASKKWSERDRDEAISGRRRYQVLSRLGPAIHNAVVDDHAMSNPGHSGFSLREADLWIDEASNDVGAFLDSAVGWSILEERPHTSKEKELATRRKWYLHPLLAPTFQIPCTRVKEPLYVEVDQVYSWLHGNAQPVFRRRASDSRKSGRSKLTTNQLPLGIDEA